MLLAYLDESYTKVDYWIAALICPESDINPLTAALDNVVAKAADSYGIGRTSELHGYSLFHGKDDWGLLAGRSRARIGIYNDAFAAIAASGARIIVRGVDSSKLVQRYSNPFHPHRVVLTHLLESIDDHAANSGNLALVIADEVDGADGYRRNLWHFQRHGTGGYRDRPIRSIVDTIHFAPSHSSRLVQGADLIAFLHCRMSSGAETDHRAI